VRRFARFNVVSAAGFAAQLATVALVTRWLDVSNVAATGLGVGAAIAHNFLWHWRWTWADRVASPGGCTAALGTSASFVRTFVRFAGANGAVSLAGNLALVAVLADAAGLDVVFANIVAVVVCGLLNFQIGDRVVFRATRRAS
jgi:putative flippase GtrA